MVKQKKTNEKVGSAVGLALGAAVAAVAGAYFIYGTKAGAKTKKKISSFGLKMKGEVLEKMESLKEVSEDKYKNIVTTVIKKYENLKKNHADDLIEIKKIGDELISHWKYIKKHSK